jgi:hypothetical protein
MAMLVAWQALNKLEDRQDAWFSDAFLLVSPGITIRDRVRVLLPSDPDNYYPCRKARPLRHDQGRLSDGSREMPRLARRRRQGVVGTEDGAGARGDARGGPLSAASVAEPTV